MSGPSADAYSQLLRGVYKETNAPWVVLDYPELVSYISGLNTDRFFEALDLVFSDGLRTGMFPRLRIWSFPEPEEE